MKYQNSKKHIDQTVNEIITGLKKLNFKSTDNIYLGIDLGKIFINDHQKIFESGDLTLDEIRKYSINKIIENLKSYFKNGTIIVPSFNFDYFKQYTIFSNTVLHEKTIGLGIYRSYQPCNKNNRQ